MRHFSFRPSVTMRGRKFKGLRGLSGKPLHPPLTDVPITAYLFAAAFDVISAVVHNSHQELGHQMYLAGSWTLLGGGVVSIFAALTGAIDWWKSSEAGTQARRTINAHASTMIVVTVLVAVDLILRLASYGDRSSTPGVIVALSVIAAALVSFGATIGGGLVFDYGFNVETAGDHPVWHKSETDVFPGQGH